MSLKSLYSTKKDALAPPAGYATKNYISKK